MKTFLMKWLLVLVCLGALSGPSYAVNPDEILSDPVLETRARAISSELRCLVCQNQSIDDSDAELARDLRLLVRERLLAGDSDFEVVAFLVDRYGEFVLLKPYFGWHTLALWGTAPLVMLIAIIALVMHLRRRKSVAKEMAKAPVPMSKVEQAALDSLDKFD